MHGGRLTAYSAGLGMGSEFAIRLPLYNGRTLQALSTANSEVNSAAEDRCRILVVDDLRDSADSLAMLLQAKGHAVHVAYEGEQAVLLAQQFRPDVALIDLGMPKVDGYEVCRRIRGHAWGAGMTLIAQTGWGQEFDRRRTQAAGFDQHMVKPLEMDLLDAQLRRVATARRPSNLDN